MAGTALQRQRTSSRLGSDPNLSGFVEPLGLTEQNTGADAVIAKSSNEPAHLVRWVKRLMNRALRKQPASQKSGAPGSQKSGTRGARGAAQNH